MTIEVKSLKRKQIKQLREKGVSLVNIDEKKIDDIIDTVLDLLYPSKAEQAILDEMEYSEVMKLFQDILGKTFGTEVVEKN